MRMGQGLVAFLCGPYGARTQPFTLRIEIET